MAGVVVGVSEYERQGASFSLDGPPKDVPLVVKLAIDRVTKRGTVAASSFIEREHRTPFSVKRAIIGAPQVRQSSLFR
jgi:hypothetical protein